MYSVVLMAALTAGGNTPTFCHGCHGSWGGCCGGYGCCGGCYGCYGGYGCCGGCYGCYGGYGCCGGCYGCYGGYGCCGGCYGCHGCYGCYGGCYGCSGCYGGYGCYGAQVITEVPPVMGGPVEGEPKKEKKKEEKREGVAVPARARVVVQLPADAKLYIDDHLMKTPSAKREFNTPQLRPGQTYYYILRTEVVRNGKTLSETKRILVKGGEEVRTSFGEPTKEYVAKGQDR